MTTGVIKDGMTLADLRLGEVGLIVAIKAPPVIRHRLLDLGFRHGERVELIRFAPLSDPIEFKLRSGYISLRRTLAAFVVIEKG